MAIIIHLLANCLLLFVQQIKSNSFDEQLKDVNKRLKKSKYFLKKAGSLKERQAAGEKLTEDEETKISKISEFESSIQFYENRIRELESVLNAPSEKKDLEKQERKLCKKIREGVSLSYKDDSKLDQFAKEKIQKLPEFRDELSRVRQRISELEHQTKDIVRQNQLEQEFLDWSIRYIKEQIGDRFLALRFLLDYLKEDYMHPDPYDGWRERTFKSIRYSQEDRERLFAKKFVSRWELKVDCYKLTGRLYTDVLYSLEKEAVDSHIPPEPPEGVWWGDILDPFQHYIDCQGGSHDENYRSKVGFRGSSLNNARMFINKYVLKFNEQQTSNVPRPYNFVKSDEIIPPGWIDLWKFLKKVFPYSKDHHLMILLYNQTVQHHFRYSRIELDYIYPYYEQHRNELYKDILSELFAEKTKANFESNGIVDLIIQFIGKRNNHFCGQATKSAPKTCIRDDCAEKPAYGYRWGKDPIYCSLHKEGDNYEFKPCEVDGCNRTPLFNFKDGLRRPLFCAGHKKKGMIDIIHATDGREWDKERDPMFAAVMSDNPFFEFTRGKFLSDIFRVLLKKIGKFQLWNYLLNDFSDPIVIKRGDWGVDEERNLIRETYPNYLERGK